jgi:two-component system, NtrC family, nitrogen regulation sensor histidine kinase NtrY
MTLRARFILFTIVLSCIALVASYFILQQDKIIFIISEVFIIAAIILALRLYNQLVKPLQLLRQGAEAIKNRDFNVKFLPSGKYETDVLIDVYNRMIDELKMERTRQEQQHFFLEKLIHTSPTGIIVLDYDENIHLINPRALHLLGISEKEVVGKSIDFIEHPVIQEIKRLKSGEQQSIKFNGISILKLHKSHFIDRGFDRHFIMIEELTTEVIAAERKAYGKVIRMMAHEVNNTIGPVNSILQTTLSSQAIWQNQENNKLQDAIQVALDRNDNLASFIRNFSDVVRLPEPRRTIVDLHKLINSISSFLKMMIKEKDIEFRYCMEPAPFHIYADEQQIGQALINIVKNSIEAIATKGVISFSTDPVAKKLIITDNGAGIPPEITDQLFTPFFSTKKEGQGIGLTLVKEILINHGYEFSLHTIPGKETHFTLTFTGE